MAECFEFFEIVMNYYILQHAPPRCRFRSSSGDLCRGLLGRAGRRSDSQVRLKGYDVGGGGEEQKGILRRD